MVLKCKCQCGTTYRKWHFLDGANITENELKTIIQEDFKENIERNIAVDKESLTNVVQRKISVKDDRPSSQCCGYIGMVIIAVPLGLMVVNDLMAMVKYFSRRY